jgi:hypothetical protein
MGLSAPDGLKGLRDRALLLLGFAGAFRRSELVALDVADLEGIRRRFQDHHPPEQDRPGRPRQNDRHRPRRHHLPRQGRQVLRMKSKLSLL